MAKWLITSQAFSPPSPPAYSIKAPWLFFVDDSIAAVFDQPEHVPCCAEEVRQHWLIIYSHGNAVDLGNIRHLLHNFCNQLDICILSYDYSGYGHSGGAASEDACYDNLLHIYHYALQTLRWPRNRIILMGRSIGSGPTVHIASELKSDALPAAIILISPIESVVRVVNRKLGGYAFDIFDNIQKISAIELPLLVAHGESDSLVAVEHGKNLYNASPRSRHKSLHIIKHANHNNLFTEFGVSVYTAIRSFLETLEHTVPTAVSSRTLRRRSIDMRCCHDNILFIPLSNLVV